MLVNNHLIVIDEQGYCRLLSIDSEGKYSIVVDKVKTYNKDEAKKYLRVEN